ncbi:MAG: DoxX family protein [Janthinobacterium lividum]
MEVSRLWFPALGVAFVVAGADKIIGNRGYSRMFRHLGWSSTSKRVVAAAEMAGGALLAARSTRMLGSAMLAATSATVLASEVRHGDGKLALPRAALLLAALTGFAGRR